MGARVSELLCVPCQVSGVRAGEDRWRLAAYVIDGESMCQDHAKAMISLLAGRSESEPGNDACPAGVRVQRHSP